MENGTYAPQSKCSIFHNNLKNPIFQRLKGACVDLRVNKTIPKDLDLALWDIWKK